MYRIDGDAESFEAATSAAQRSLDRLQETGEEAARAMEDAADRSAQRWQAAAAALGAALAEVQRQIDAVEQQQRNLRIETGGAGPGQEQLLAGLLGAGFADTEATAAIGALTGSARGLGVSPTDFGVAQSLASVAAIGGDPTAAAQGLVGFGVTGAGNVTGTLDVALQAGLSQGVDPSTIIGGLRDYGPVLSALGLSAVESAEFISDLSAEGIDISRVSPALNRFIRDASEAGIAPRTAAQDAFADIAGASDVEAAALGQELFGAEGGLRLTQAIRSGRVGLGDQLDVGRVIGAPTLPSLAQPTGADSYDRTLEAARLRFAQGDLGGSTIPLTAFGFASSLVGSLPLVGDFGEDVINAPGRIARSLRGGEQEVIVRIVIDPAAQRQGIEASVTDSRRSGRLSPYDADPIGRGL